jgi:hypothetical protein
VDAFGFFGAQAGEGTRRIECQQPPVFSNEV